MKLCKLKLKNLNSFRGEIEIDFEKYPLDEASLVAIIGPTGAGKTTLLDAICVALYGKTPRLAGTGTQNPIHLLSHGETEGHAELHFVANSVRYLAEWSVRRERSPKGQLRSASDDTLITDRLSTQGSSSGSSDNTISEEIEAILGLDFNAFKRSVMLAQGEFAAFLKANDEDRRKILEATAGVDIYDRLRDKLNQEVGNLRNARQEIMQQLNGISEASQQPSELESHLRDLNNRLDDCRQEIQNVRQGIMQQLNGISEASQQPSELESHLRDLNNRLDDYRQEIQAERQRESERARRFEELRIAEERNEELLDQQAQIETLETELERAERANGLRAAREAFDRERSEFESAETSLCQAENELREAQRQFDENQTDFNEKDKAYQIALVQHNEQINHYNTARLDVRQATDRFTRARELDKEKRELVERIETLSTELTTDKERYDALAVRFGTINTFLENNPLPPDYHERLTATNSILTERRIRQEQLREREEAAAASASEVSRLSIALEQLDREREKIVDRNEVWTASLADAEATLTELQEQGTLEEGRTQRQRAERMRSIALGYETNQDQLVESEADLQEIQNRLTTLDSNLDMITSQLACQSQVCQEADDVVERCETERESALLASPINQLRRQLEPGQPCRVCGATEHPCGNDIEPEGTKRLENAENTLANAKEAARSAHARRENLEREKTLINQEMSNIKTQIETACEKKHNIESGIQSMMTEWQAIYPNVEVSSDWIDQQIREADNAVSNHQQAHEAHTRASHLCHTIAQELDNCDQNIVRERGLLDVAQQSLQEDRNTVEDLEAEIEDIEVRLWELLPDDLHGIEPEDAVNRFADRIRTVVDREREREQIQNEMGQINIRIRERKRSLETEQERRDELQAEIEGYRNEGNDFLQAVQDRTSGLTTVSEIDAADARSEEELEANSVQRDEAERLFRKSETALTEAQTNHSNHHARRDECSKKFEAAKNDYLEKLKEAGFESPEAHDSAFREEDWIQQISQRIATYTDARQQLENNVAILRAIFEENPFNRGLLDTIKAAAPRIGHEISAQQGSISILTDALARWTSIRPEWERWSNLQNTIPANKLRDFALDIMFKQVSRIANAQMEYLTSGRYRLKVEGIGKLTVIDRWNANDERPVETLSGGESFQTSLALALAISELSRGRAQIYSLFLDEGFGTLDSETLDVAIASLEGLQMQGRNIFLISHVGELTRRIPVQIAVQKMGNGSSQVRVHG